MTLIEKDVVVIGGGQAGLARPATEGVRKRRAWRVAKGKLTGKQPPLSAIQSKELRRVYDTGDHSIGDLMSRPKFYRPLAR